MGIVQLSSYHGMIFLKHHRLVHCDLREYMMNDLGDGAYERLLASWFGIFTSHCARFFRTKTGEAG